MPTIRNYLVQWFARLFWTSIIFVPFTMAFVLIWHMIVFDIDKFRKDLKAPDWPE